MTKVLRLVGTDSVRVCGEKSASARAVRSKDELFSLLTERANPTFVEAVLADLDDVIAGDFEAMPSRATTWLTKSQAEESDERTED